MSTSKFDMTTDINGQNGFGLTPSTVIRGASLATGVAQSTTLPTDYPQYVAIFSYTPGANVFVNYTTTASAYGAMGAVTSELNPQARKLPAGTTISFITPDAAGAYVEAAIYVVQPYIN